MGNKKYRIVDGQQKYRIGDGQQKYRGWAAMLNGRCAGAAPLAGYKAGHWRATLWHWCAGALFTVLKAKTDCCHTMLI